MNYVSVAGFQGQLEGTLETHEGAPLFVSGDCADVLTRALTNANWTSLVVRHPAGYEVIGVRREMGQFVAAYRGLDFSTPARAPKGSHLEYAPIQF